MCCGTTASTEIGYDRLHGNKNNETMTVSVLYTRVSRWGQKTSTGHRVAQGLCSAGTAFKSQHCPWLWSHSHGQCVSPLVLFLQVWYTHCYSKYSFPASTISIILGLARNTEPQVLPQTSRITTCMLITFSRGFMHTLNLRNNDIGYDLEATFQNLSFVRYFKNVLTNKPRTVDSQVYGHYLFR